MRKEDNALGQIASHVRAGFQKNAISAVVTLTARATCCFFASHSHPDCGFARPVITPSDLLAIDTSTATAYLVYRCNHTQAIRSASFTHQLLVVQSLRSVATFRLKRGGRCRTETRLPSTGCTTRYCIRRILLSLRPTKSE